MPRGLPKKVKVALEKARDSALLAVEVYNKPAISFKSGGYIVFMIIAWTAFFHSIFFREGKKPFYKEKNGRKYLRRDGEYVYWELERCLQEYYASDTSNPVRQNLKFFIRLRNIIEHKSLPEIDSDIFGECQSMLLNFDELVEKEFGTKYCIREALSFSLQLYPSSESLARAVANSTTKSVVEFIENYRSSISATTLDSGKYSFKAFLIQVANHPSRSALPIQFIRYDTLTKGEKEKVKRIATMIKYKYKEVPVSNIGLLKPKKVVKRVQEQLGNPKIDRNGSQLDKFNMTTHTRFWKKYRVRPDADSDEPQATDETYCCYDEPNGDYLYTQGWVDFLVEKMKSEAEYRSLFKIHPQ